MELHKKEAERLKSVSKNLPTDPQFERILFGIEDRIEFLITRAKQGLKMIEVNLKLYFKISSTFSKKKIFFFYRTQLMIKRNVKKKFKNIKII